MRYLELQSGDLFKLVDEEAVQHSGCECFLKTAVPRSLMIAAAPFAPAVGWPTGILVGVGHDTEVVKIGSLTEVQTLLAIAKVKY